MEIKFRKHFVTNGETKARVYYSNGTAINTDRLAVTLYPKDYTDGPALSAIFADKYENDSDPMADYFDDGVVRIYDNDPLYPAALTMCNQ
jgi:hypothetical protein